MKSHGAEDFASGADSDGQFLFKQRPSRPTTDDLAVTSGAARGHKTAQEPVQDVDRHDAKSVSSYSEMLHPNADPSEFSVLNELPGQKKKKVPKLGCFKRGCAWIDEHWLKRLLVGKNLDQMQAADEIDELLERVMHEDPTDTKSVSNNANFMSISPVIRDALEKRRAEELRQGRHASMSLL